MENKTYDASSVQQLSFREGVRLRVASYLNSADHIGVIAGLLELVNNATDEGLVCKDAKTIEIVIGKDWASCRDYGRGMPHGPNNFSKEVMINLLTENHSGAKFNDNAYGGKSRGLNGTGSAATCCSSDWFKISSYRDGAEWYMEFENGIPKWGECQKKPLNGQAQGTYIIYKPSQEVFKSEPIYFDYKEICELMEEYSYFNPGITFVVTDAETKKVNKYISVNGLRDFAKKKINKAIHQHPLYIKATENDIDVEIIMQWTASGKEKFYLFSNGGENPDGGTPITGIKTAITNFLKKQVKSKNEYDADILRKGLEYICSVNLKNPIYGNGQTKGKITNPELRGLCQRLTTKMLEEFVKKYPNEFENVLTTFEKEIKAEAAAEKARQNVLNMQKDVEKASKAKISNTSKLQDARKLGKDAILVIVEGESAGGSVAMGRDDNIGILKLRGKMLNLEVSTEEEWTKNVEVKLLQQALGISYGKPYDPSKLRYGKVAVASDADADGSHISMLVTINLWNLCPQIIKENRLFRLEAPLYKVHTKTKNYFYYSEEEFNKGHEKGEILRFKGLGQMEPEDLKESMFSPEFQKLTPYEYSEEGIELLKDLMGNDVNPKKDFVFENVDFENLIIE